jgi:hypothetical protein
MTYTAQGVCQGRSGAIALSHVSPVPAIAEERFFPDGNCTGGAVSAVR